MPSRHPRLSNLCTGHWNQILSDRLERQLRRLVDVPENASIAEIMDGNGQHRPFPCPSCPGPKGYGHSTGQQTVRHVIEMMIDRGDSSAALPTIGDRPGDITDEVDDRERENEATPADFPGVEHHHERQHEHHYDLLGTRPEPCLPGMKPILRIHTC